MEALRTKLGKRARRVVYAAVSIAVGILAAEGVIRGYAHIGSETGRRLAVRDPLAILFEPYGEFGYRQKPNKIQRYGNGTRAIWNSMGYRGPLVSRTKPDGTFRIILLGGSATHGFGVNNDETIDAHMRDHLGQRFVKTRFEVINLALGGYDSYQVFERMRTDGVKLLPDLVIVNSGINDVANARFSNLTEPPDPRILRWSNVMTRMREEAKRGGPSLRTLARHYSYLARVPGYIHETFLQRKAMRGPILLEPNPDAIDYFEVNLLRTIELAENVGAGVILSTPPSALTTKYKPSDPPARSYWVVDAATTEEYRQRLARRMRKVAQDQQALGRRVRYVSRELPPGLFLDDAHLTSAGNRAMAANLVEAAVPFIDAAFPILHKKQ